MAILNAGAREIEAKLVYYGTALGGKTTNLKVLHRLAEPEQRQQLVSLNSAGDRTLFFDVLPFDLGTVLGWQVRLKLYSIPGQPEYSETRRVVLNASDAIVFVADSSPARHAENRRSIGFLKQNLKQNQIDAERIPLVFQWNKRDLPDAMPAADLDRDLNWRACPSRLAIATRGEGVLDTFEAATAHLVRALLERYAGRGRAALTLEEAREIVHEKLVPLYARWSDWSESRPGRAAPSPRHVVLSGRPPLSSAASARSSHARVDGDKTPCSLARPGRPADPGEAFEVALENEIRLLNDLVELESQSAAAAGPARAALSFESEPLRLALVEASLAHSLEATAAPMLRLACELAGVSAGTVLAMTAGAGPLTEVAHRGLGDEPLNRPGPGGGVPPSRTLAFSSSALWGPEVGHAARAGGPALEVGSRPVAALPLIAGRRRAGLLILHGDPALELAPEQRSALELVAAMLALLLVVRGLERKLVAMRAVGTGPEPAVELSAVGV